MRASTDGAPLIPPMRRLLYVAAFLVFLAGLQLFVLPLHTADWFAWTVDPPMTAVFLGAAYWSSAVLEVAGARSADWGRARLSVWTVFVFTALTLAVTLVHLDRFHLSAEHPISARAVTWGWLAIYIAVPIAMLTIGSIQSRARHTPTGSIAAAAGALPAGLRLLLVVIAAVLVLVGAGLLAAPTQAATLWPWMLTELTARAVGAWSVGLGWAAAHARLSGDARTVRPLGLTAIAFVVLQTVALLRHGDDVTWAGAPAVGFLAVLLAIGVAGGWMVSLNRVPKARSALASS
ncbi:hypothetical protein GCM10023169_25970 [Georgenia halophila]|uniref:Uncharacterized protein n=1 Tax=Georgenia halophila TaxID=620889 RepID=A0ABP8LBZ7_9MICO